VIVELASLEVEVQRAGEFAEAFPAAQAVLARAHGLVSSQLLRDLEQPGRFIIQAYWSTLEDHTHGFRQSELFEEFRAVVGPFLREPPDVRHFRLPLGPPVPGDN
jgi:heme-degrading monooxygenase HmoA